MNVKVFEFEQNSEEWFQARAGLVTSSEMDAVMANGRGGEPSKTRAKYMRKLAGERITGQPGERFSRPELERGHTMEDEARAYYALAAPGPIQRVGFVLNEEHRAGCSPDAFVGDDGLLEIKTKRADIFIECLLLNQFPSEHVRQCVSQLAFTGRRWVDICVYWPGMPRFVKRLERYDEQIDAVLTATYQFNRELDDLVEKVRRWS